MIDIIEEWRPVVGYEGLYEVSNTGFVRRVSDLMVFKLSDLKGYCIVRLRKDGKGKSYLVHRLVAQAFIPNPLNLPQVNHIDENKKNNNIDNLEWCTAKYNANYGTRNIRVRETAIKNGYCTGLSREEYNKKWRENNKDYQKKWRENNKDYHKKWLEKHPGYMDKYKKE